MHRVHKKKNIHFWLFGIHFPYSKKQCLNVTPELKMPLFATVVSELWRLFFFFYFLHTSFVVKARYPRVIIQYSGQQVREMDPFIVLMLIQENRKSWITN
ncbi:hypothetical protein ILYODFUR_014842 [Ilyodon furcidens]|uniref:Uncharacterized protein n=1 Tax=Ilyodon furcidens TaxID=33524 RepID=A0ABV0VE20_9TELE